MSGEAEEEAMTDLAQAARELEEALGHANLAEGLLPLSDNYVIPRMEIARLSRDLGVWADWAKEQANAN